MPRIYENIVPRTMTWARNDAGHKDIESAADKARIPPEKLLKWESGDEKPTVSQLRNIAKVYHRPPAFFYLKEIAEHFKIERPTDFRRLDEVANPWSPNLRLMTRQAHERQEWTRNLLGDEAEKQLWVASSDMTTPRLELARKIRRWLDVSNEKQKGFLKRSDFLKFLISQIEQKGAFVSNHRPDMNRYRTVEPKEFRGIALKDKVAPLVVLNPKDAVAGRIFTIVHEIVHLWVNAPGISNREPENRKNTVEKKTESFCNNVASRVLMPEEWFSAEWKRSSGHLEEKIEKNAEIFLVSKEAVARRLSDRKIIKWKQYLELREKYQKELDDYKKRKKEKQSRTKSGGMAVGLRVRLENGRKLTRLVLESYRNKEISILDVSSVLNFKLDRLDDVASEVDFNLPKRNF